MQKHAIQGLVVDTVMHADHSVRGNTRVADGDVVVSDPYVVNGDLRAVLLLGSYEECHGFRVTDVDMLGFCLDVANFCG